MTYAYLPAYSEGTTEKQQKIQRQENNQQRRTARCRRRQEQEDRRSSERKHHEERYLQPDHQRQPRLHRPGLRPVRTRQGLLRPDEEGPQQVRLSPIPTDHTAGCHGSQRTAAARFSAMKALRSSRTHGMTSANRTKSGLFHFCRITPISRERNPSGRSLFLPYASPAVRKRLRVRRVFAPEAKSVLDSPVVSLKKTGGATQSAVVGFAPDEIRVNIHGCDRANRKHHNHCQNPGFRQYTS